MPSLMCNKICRNHPWFSQKIRRFPELVNGMCVHVPEQNASMSVNIGHAGKALGNDARDDVRLSSSFIILGRSHNF